MHNYLGLLHYHLTEVEAREHKVKYWSFCLSILYNKKRSTVRTKQRDIASFQLNLFVGLIDVDVSFFTIFLMHLS